MRVAIGSDHAGFSLKGELCSLLDELRVEYRDFGTFSDEPVDYPDFIAPVARAVARGDFELGIVIGGSGTGEAIVANKVRGIRCVQAPTRSWRASRASTTTPTSSPSGRGSSGPRWRGPACASSWPATFQGGRHVPRVEKIARIEAEEAGR